MFPVLHGAYGEDGTIQGLLELAGIPYVGPGVLASAAGMDKEFTKKLLAAEGLPVGFQVVLRPGTSTVTDEQKQQLGLPVFVKPARGGSSIGITRVADWSQFDAAVAVARSHDPKVIVESAIVGREVECGVLEFPDGDVRASVVAEIRMPDTDGDESAFYDFDTKYLDDVCEFDVPAQARRRRQRTDPRPRGPCLPRAGLPGAGPRRLLRHCGRTRDQRDQHDAGLHVDLDVPAHVAGRRCRVRDARLDARRHGRGARDGAALS